MGQTLNLGADSVTAVRLWVLILRVGQYPQFSLILL